MWPDNVSETDYINFFEVSDLISDLVSNEKLRPVSVGVFGGWGSGKSTLIQLSKDHLREDDSYIIVDFDAWLYQDFDDARSALLEAVSVKLLEASAEEKGTLDKAKSLFNRVNKLRVLGLLAEGGALLAGAPAFGMLYRGVSSAGEVIAGESDSDDVETVKKSIKEASYLADGLVKPQGAPTPPQEISEFRCEFSSLLQEIDKTLVVYVDNLDRCLPKNAIMTLEAIRLILFMPNTAFVIAADEDMVRLAVAEHYKTVNGRLINDYLDKLIQVPVNVPRLGVAEVTSYVFLLFCSTFEWSDTQDKSAIAFVQKSLQLLWKKPLVSSTEIITHIEKSKALSTHEREYLESAYSLASRLAPMLARSPRVAGNPRIIKRLLNTIWMRSSISEKRNMPTNIDRALIAKIAIFERCMGEAATTELYRLINETEDGKPSIISELEEAETVADVTIPDSWSDLQFIDSWTNLEPKLGGVDLRAIVYLARETLPIRLSVDGLSAAAEAAVLGLLKIKALSSPSVKSILKNLPNDDRAMAMEGLIDHLRKTTSWSKRPNGFAGAIALARASDEAGKKLKIFVASIGTPPPWLKTQLKDEAWWTGGY